jgi:hypothetical protein
VILPGGAAPGNLKFLLRQETPNPLPKTRKIAIRGASRFSEAKCSQPGHLMPFLARKRFPMPRIASPGRVFPALTPFFEVNHQFFLDLK